MLAGAAVGAVIGGLAGKGVGEAVNPTAEDAHWRTAHSNESYARSELGYEEYAPAYKLGYESRDKYPGQTFDQAQGQLENQWDQTRGTSSLEWNDAKHATKAAWHRVERAVPGDADGDGR